jgi:hypothetical protein
MQGSISTTGTWPTTAPPIGSAGPFFEESLEKLAEPFGAAGDAVRSAGESLASNMEEVGSSTGSPIVAGYSGFEASLVRSLSGMVAGIVGLPGTLAGAATEVGAIVDTAKQQGVLAAAARTTGMKWVGEAIVGIDSNGNAIGDWGARLNYAARGFNQLSAVTGLAAGALRAGGGLLAASEAEAGTAAAAAPSNLAGGGATRAAGRNWQAASLETAIERHAGPNYTSWTTATGKTIFENPATGRQVVVDQAGGYFRIFQPNSIGSAKGTYLNLIGNDVTPARFMSNSSIGTPLLRDVDKGLWQQETHFFIGD